MKATILVLVFAAIILAIASGLWVAIALISAVSTRRNAVPDHDEKSNDDQHRTSSG
jgi:hypothetical protein